MKSLSDTSLPNEKVRTTRWHNKGLWMGAITLVLFAVIFASGMSWVSILNFAPYLLFLACPAMFLFMCYSQKNPQNESDTSEK